MSESGTSGSGPGQFFSLRSIAVLGSTLYATESTRLQKMDATKKARNIAPSGP